MFGGELGSETTRRSRKCDSSVVGWLERLEMTDLLVDTSSDQGCFGVASRLIGPTPISVFLVQLAAVVHEVAADRIDHPALRQLFHVERLAVVRVDRRLRAGRPRSVSFGT